MAETKHEDSQPGESRDELMKRALNGDRDALGRMIDDARPGNAGKDSGAGITGFREFYGSPTRKRG